MTDSLTKIAAALPDRIDPVCAACGSTREV
jgi:hypothetical protein